MTERGELISLLESLSEEKFRVFNEKIVHTSKYRVIGVRMPDLKAIAKEHKADYKEIFELPYDSFEEIGCGCRFCRRSAVRKRAVYYTLRRDDR